MGVGSIPELAILVERVCPGRFTGAADPKD
jgi:hypothetical protein